MPDCTSIPETFQLATINGCQEIKICVGYAKCVVKGEKEEVVSKFICEAENNRYCPSANECLKQFESGSKIKITKTKERAENGFFRKCDSHESLGELDESKDYLDSRFCDVVSGVRLNFDDSKDSNPEPVPGMTGAVDDHIRILH